MQFLPKKKNFFYTQNLQLPDNPISIKMGLPNAKKN